MTLVNFPFLSTTIGLEYIVGLLNITRSSSTTIAALLTWAETRKGQIEAAITAYNNAYKAAFDSWIAAGKTPGTFNELNSETNSYWDWSKTWKDYDSNYS